MERPELEIRKAVKERYSKLATSKGCGCGDNCCNEENCCSGGSSLITIGDFVPPEASSVNAGCGSPLELISPARGDVVLDLGSGGGIDVFRASQIVGKEGRAIGVDATPEMILRARETALQYGEKYENTEFRLGEIENLPIDSNSVDYVISNCVINLSPDKRRVFKEAFRSLKSGGTFAVADITVNQEIPDSSRENMDSWSACISGGLTESEYRRLLIQAGFEDIEIESISEYSPECCAGGDLKSFKFYSSHIKARKSIH